MNATARRRGGPAAGTPLAFRRLAAAALACGAVWAQAAQAKAPAERPAAGRQAGELCVQTGDSAPQCGPAELELRGDRLRVQVSDIAYRLKLRSSQADVALMHGSMQIDEFVADYHWAPQGLQFFDDQKGTRYEVRWSGAKKPR